jgi:hypothetical protein
MDGFIPDRALQAYRESLAEAPPEEQQAVLLLLVECLLEAERGELTEHFEVS